MQITEPVPMTYAPLASREDGVVGERANRHLLKSGGASAGNEPLCGRLLLHGAN